jgi:SP family myo-inositol transporter-like MFS transporter 13
LADKYGRKKIFQWGVASNLLVMTVTMASTSYWLTIGSIFVIGMITTVRIGIGYNYMQELVPDKFKTRYSTIWMVQEGCISLYAVLYFGILNKHWFYFVAIGYLFNVAAIPMVYFLPESPPWLVKKGEFARAQESLESIAAFNKETLKFDKH